METVTSIQMLKSVINGLSTVSTATVGQKIMLFAADGTPVGKMQAPTEEQGTSIRFELNASATASTQPSATAGEATMGLLYLVGPENGTKYQWITIEDDSTTPSTYSWLNIGSTNIDLSQYATLTVTDALAASLAALGDDIEALQEAVAEGAVYDVSAKNPTAGPNNDGKWESLAALLSDANLSTLIPTSVRKGGMSIKFVCSSDNNYVRHEYMGSSTAVADFTNVANWRGVDEVPIKDSRNLVTSGAVYAATLNQIAIQATVEEAVITVKVDDVIVATGTGSLTTAIEYGKVFTVECSRVYDYVTPEPQTFTASPGVQKIFCNYTYIEQNTITLDQTETDELSMITGDVQGDVIKAIRAASHLYLGTPITQEGDEEGNQLICQLKDDDGTKYSDGTTAAMDGTEGDQWLKLPVFWWKVTPIGEAAEDGSYDQYSFSFAFAGEPDPTWKKWEGDKNLLGAKKMYVSDGKGYSRSGIQGSASFTRGTGIGYATARGLGYRTVTWEWQWMMCVLFYAWYGRMNSQAQCGKGSDSRTRTLGTKDSLGMTDTTNSNGNSDNTKFWGIENWWGDLAEWIDNITSSNYVVTITDMNTGATRQVSGWYQFGGTAAFITRFKVTENLDFIPVAVGGTETTSYCDAGNGNTGSRVVRRSVSYASTGGGVAFVYSNVTSSYTDAVIGSRLAFRGSIVEAESVAAYKAALPAGQEA